MTDRHKADLAQRASKAFARRYGTKPDSVVVYEERVKNPIERFFCGDTAVCILCKQGCSVAQWQETTNGRIKLRSENWAAYDLAWGKSNAELMTDREEARCLKRE